MKLNIKSTYINGERYTTYTNYMIENAQSEFSNALKKKLPRARKAKGLSRNDLSQVSGVDKPSITMMEKRRTLPPTDMIFKLLIPLGYTISIVPIKTKQL